MEQLLFLARGDSGRNTLHFVEFNLNDVVTEVWEESMMIDEKHRYRLMLPNTEGKTVPVTGDPEEDGELAPVSVTGDVAMLKQTMRILVQNAAKYSNEGDAITIGTRFVDGEPAFTVQDEGMGMHEKDVSHIFERFYRSDVARAGNTGGSGLTRAFHCKVDRGCAQGNHRGSVASGIRNAFHRDSAFFTFQNIIIVI